ncbi:MAG: hypothetical protein LBB74_10825 [Chitinispirillales bacterium]|jgi:hypothetical protein|nr:hypothetical protein [Chitinispirillales bacterium]
MNNQIERFNKRYPNVSKTNDGGKKTSAPLKSIEEAKPDETAVFEPTAQTETANDRIALAELTELSEDTGQIEHRINALQAMIKETAGKEFISDRGPVRLKNNGFIYDIASNAVFFENNEKICKEICAEFISYNDGGSHDDIHPHAIVDFALNDIASVRRCCVKNDYGHVAEIVKETLNGMEENDGRFYYLPDNTDVFSNNVKSGFSGYTYVWRSVAAAYRYCYGAGKGDAGKIDVVDLFENEPVKISIKAEIGEKYDNEIMFTRCDRNKLDDAVQPLSYVSVAKAFWEEYLKKRRLPVSKEAIDRLICGNATHELLCGGRPFDLVYKDRLYTVSAPEAKDFLKRYVSKNVVAVNKLVGCVVYGDFLALAGAAVKMPVLLPDAGHGEPLARYMERKKRDIPLWIETLPKLVLDRIVDKRQKRLGRYVLVEDNKTVENLFEPRVIKCEERLTLPAGHKEIRFPLTIGGITDKKYVATVKMDDELKTAAEFDVRLVYDFNDRNSYRFVLKNEEAGEKRLLIEEGEPERMYLPFVMGFCEDEEVLTEIYDKIYKGLCEAENEVDKWDWDKDRRYNDNVERKEMRWEYGVRTACRQIFLAWVGLPYKQKEQKEMGQDIGQKASDILEKVLDLNLKSFDDIGRFYVEHIIATLALILSDVEYDLYRGEYFSKNKDIGLSPAFVTTVLCNPNVSYTSECIKAIVGRCGGNDESGNKRIGRTFSLPLLANEKLLGHICERENELKILSRLVKHLSTRFDELCKELREKPIIPKTLRKIRDAYELSLSLLRLRETRYWSKVKGIEGALSSAKELEERLYDKLNEKEADPGDYSELVEEYKKSADDHRWEHDKLDCELLISRVIFKPVDGVDLSLMHPLALTAITYLDGNPNIHMVSCGLRGDD